MLDRAHQRADSLSDDQQQRVAIARVLAQQARLVLVDKPVASLDPQSAENVLGTLRTIAREEGIALLCALHQVDLARRFADRVVALRCAADRGSRKRAPPPSTRTPSNLYGVADRMKSTA